MELTTLYPSQCALGESPFWHRRRKSYLWVDINPGVLYELKHGTESIQKWKINLKVSVIFEHTDGNVLLGVEGGLVKFKFETGETEWLADLDREIFSNRCNDGACDSEGRIWIGTMDVRSVEGRGSLYCIYKGLQVQKKISGVSIPNGLVWSLENERMFFVDSSSRKIESYLFNKSNGGILVEKDVVIIPAEMGIPDGMTIDQDGMLWVALYGGFCVGRWDPKTGELLEKIDLPVPNVTNCCFVGENLAHLMITTARENLSTAQLTAYPGSGDVFIVKDLGIKGFKNNKTDLNITSL